MEVSDLSLVRAHLEMERKRLSSELQSKLEQSVVEIHEGSPYGKREETATESSELESRLTVAQYIREQLAEVEHALGKLARGTYGLCDSCGKPIPLARLKAIPQANLCFDCKAHQTPG